MKKKRHFKKASVLLLSVFSVTTLIKSPAGDSHNCGAYASMAIVSRRLVCDLILAMKSREITWRVKNRWATN